jgi:hypothetical protein
VLRIYLAAVVVLIKASEAPMAKSPNHRFMYYSDNCHLSNTN